MGDAVLKTPAYGYACHDTSGKFSPFTFKRRETGPKDVTFTVKYCGICHSDLHYAKNEWGNAKYPVVAGHEVAGVVTEVGSEVTKFKVGDSVGVGCLVNSCRTCDNCKEGFEQYCTTGNVLTYGGKDVDDTITYGGYSNFLVCNEDFVLKIPASLQLDEAAPLLCAGITVYSPMKYYGMDVAGKDFGVIGLGGLGSMAAKFAKAFGMKLTVISTSPSKEKEARESLKADHFIISKDEESMKAAAASLDFIIDTVSAPHPVEPALNLLKVNGKYILVGVPPHVMEISPTSLVFGRKLIAGSLIGGIKETQEMLDFCGEHQVLCEIEKIPIEYVNTAMDRLLKSDVHYRFVIDVENTLKPQV